MVTIKICIFVSVIFTKFSWFTSFVLWCFCICMYMCVFFGTKSQYWDSHEDTTFYSSKLVLLAIVSRHIFIIFLWLMEARIESFLKVRWDKNGYTILAYKFWIIEFLIPNLYYYYYNNNNVTLSSQSEPAIFCLFYIDSSKPSLA